MTLILTWIKNGINQDQPNPQDFLRRKKSPLNEGTFN